MSDIRDTVIENGYVAGCALGDVAVLIWRQPPSDAGIRDLRAVFRAMKTRRPTTKFGLLVIIEQDAGYSMSKSTRDLLGKLLEEYSGDIAGSAIVCEGSTVLSTIVRTVAKTFTLINRTGFKTEVRADVASGADALREICAKYAVAASPSSLRQAVEELRAQASPAARHAR